ncbi:MAG: ferrous iron transport protein B, partial [Anaerovoracaceae bacterium]
MKIRIALVGNPNCGKTTMFNELTGSNQYVGNWPGVTVEKKEGKLRGHKDVVITDLPGIYSLSPYTLDEVVSRDYLVDEKPDAIINLVDGTNLERNLFLTTQLVELGIPTVLAINMMDIVQKNGDKINIKQIEKAFGCKVVLMSALKKTGLMTAAEEAIKLSLEDVHAHTPAEELVHQHISKVFTIPVEEALEKIITLTGEAIAGEQQRWFAVKLFERDEKIQKKLGLSKAIIDEIDKVIARAETILDDDAEAIITNERYDEITSVMEGAVKKGRMGLSTSDKIDRIVTNRFLALPIFAAIMFLVYFVSVTTIGTIVTDWTNDVFFGEWIQPAVKGMLENVGAAEWLNGLIVDGIIGGVGAVLGFVPQMFILFFFLSFLEDCGYMARVAFIMDRVFRKFGLSGKSFIPMLISSGCGVPGVMATKTIENEKDRRMTIMTTT